MDASRAKNTKAPHYEVQELAIEGTLVWIVGIETHPSELIALKQKINVFINYFNNYYLIDFFAHQNRSVGKCMIGICVIYYKHKTKPKA